MPQFVTSSMIGVDLVNSGSTALFALNTKVLGSDNSEWSYVIATAALTTGQCVYIAPQGTANLMTTAQVAAATAGMQMGFAQGTFGVGAYGFVALRGMNLYIVCSGTAGPNTSLAFSATPGAFVTSLLAAVGNTAAGIFITTSASTGTVVPTLGIVTWPRAVAGVALG